VLGLHATVASAGIDSWTADDDPSLVAKRRPDPSLVTIAIPTRLEPSLGARRHVFSALARSRRDPEPSRVPS
jgi:hypothetical protein